MKNLFTNLNEKISKMLEDDSSLLSKAKKKWEDQYVPVPITSEMILSLLHRQTFEGISNLEVQFVGDRMVISGSAKKMGMNIFFKVEMKAMSAAGRKINFEVVDMKPINQDWIKKKVFNQPPMMTYDSGHITMDLDAMESIRDIPWGTIKSFEIKDNMLWVGIGI
ncbi:hypothetical protein [Peribacillus acanthi]|uniref:hypothetical protein n=1 Tax=Peribacillus acanthi TaxID=2171554 RepID=UPI000D3EA614|nr:hypothetical protein [Peribacillus acanthi]